MRSLILLLAALLLIPGVALAASVIETQGAACTDVPYAGFADGTGIAIVEVSGHGDTTIDGAAVAPAGTGTYQGYTTVYYPAGSGTHTIAITGPGYYPYINNMAVCTGKVSYAYYDQASRLQPGMTRPSVAATTAPAATTAAALPSTQYSGQSADLKAALSPGQSLPPGSYGSLSVTTDPAGASIYIDGVLLGVTPATLPGLSAGSHTMILKLDGYDDLTLPVTIAAGSTQYYSSALKKGGNAAAAPVGPTTKKSPVPVSVIILAAGLSAALLARGKNPS